MTLTRRPGVTLTEVLVAIFITGIGLMSLIVLFPLGALNMAQAIKDQRSADASRIAESLARAFDFRNDVNAFQAFGTPGTAPTTGPSYIAYIDPQGCKITGGTPGAWTKVGGVSGVNRVYPSALATGSGTATGIDFTNAQIIQRWTTLQDEFTFEVDGAPETTPRFATPVGTGTVARSSRYSWAWMLQQTRASTTNPTPSGVNLTVVVYDRRPLVPGSSTPLEEEIPCTARFNAGSNVVNLSWSGTKPQLKRGSWILDATTTPQINGYWYRVVAVTPTSSNSAEVELHMNARAAGNGPAIVMDSVVEVFDKGQ